MSVRVPLEAEARPNEAAISEAEAFGSADTSEMTVLASPGRFSELRSARICSQNCARRILAPGRNPAVSTLDGKRIVPNNLNRSIAAGPPGSGVRKR